MDDESEIFECQLNDILKHAKFWVIYLINTANSNENVENIQVIHYLMINFLSLFCIIYLNHNKWAQVPLSLLLRKIIGKLLSHKIIEPFSTIALPLNLSKNMKE